VGTSRSRRQTGCARGAQGALLRGPSTSPVTAMRKIALAFAALGMLSGVLFAIGPFLLGTPTGSPASFVLPVILGTLVVTTHGLNWQRLHASNFRFSRGWLLAFNLTLLVFFLFGFVGMYRIGTVFPHQPIRMIAFLVLWPLPFAVNAAYLCAPGTAQAAR
jgi:hypothetical protein